MSKDSPDNIRQVTATEVPAFLRPFVEQSAATSSRALGGLEDMLTGSGGGLSLPQGARVEGNRVVRDVTVPGAPGGGFSTIGSRRLPISSPSTTQTIDLGPVSQFTQPATAQPDLVAGFDPTEEQALALAEQRALGEGGFIPTFQDQILSTAQGDFLHGGQGFNEAVDAAERRILPNVMNRFAASGRGTGGLAQIGAAQALSDSFASLFNSERERQMRAIGALPGAAAVDTDLLSRIGAARRGMAQREIDAPITALERLLASGQGGPGSFSPLFGGSTSQPLFSNPVAGALGGASTGLGLMGGVAGLTGGSVPAFGALTSALGPAAGAAASWAIPAAVLGGLLT